MISVLSEAPQQNRFAERSEERRQGDTGHIFHFFHFVADD
jgi:hypothetical protein